MRADAQTESADSSLSDRRAAKNAFGNGELGVVDECLGIHDLAESQAVAVRAGAVGRVEREVARLQVVDGVAVNGAGKRQRVLQELALA